MKRIYTIFAVLGGILFGCLCAWIATFASLPGIPMLGGY